MNILICDPSLSEQTQIVHSIETHTARIDATISQIEKSGIDYPSVITI